MIIAGFKPDSFVDWRGKVVATVFTYGCNFRCPFCHNFYLVTEKLNLRYDSEDIIKKVRELEEWIDGVCITGGEPTIHEDIVIFIKKLSKIKPVKLDTNGSRPDMLRKVIKYVDYVAMDIKAPPEKYSKLAGVHVDIEKIEDSIKIIKSYAKDYEFRTTFAPTLSPEDIGKISKWVSGANRYVIQQFSTNGGTLDPEFSKLDPHRKEDIARACDLARENVKKCMIANI